MDDDLSVQLDHMVLAQPGRAAGLALPHAPRADDLHPVNAFFQALWGVGRFKFSAWHSPLHRAALYLQVSTREQTVAGQEPELRVS